MISINSDFLEPECEPIGSLRQIARAGFDCVHWCHGWNSPKIYSRAEISQIKKELQTLGLSLNNLHGSLVPEADWTSADGEIAARGAELVKNCMEMCAELGGGGMVLHLGAVFSQDPRHYRTLTLSPMEIHHAQRLRRSNTAR